MPRGHDRHRPVVAPDIAPLRDADVSPARPTTCQHVRGGKARKGDDDRGANRIGVSLSFERGVRQEKGDGRERRRAGFVPCEPSYPPTGRRHSVVRRG